MITGPAGTIMLAFFGIGSLLMIYALWALYLTDIPEEQFIEDFRFYEEYTRYYQILFVFGMVMVSFGGIINVIARKMRNRRK